MKADPKLARLMVVNSDVFDAHVYSTGGCWIVSLSSRVGEMVILEKSTMGVMTWMDLNKLGIWLRRIGVDVFTVHAECQEDEFTDFIEGVR